MVNHLNQELELKIELIPIEQAWPTSCMRLFAWFHAALTFISKFGFVCFIYSFIFNVRVHFA